jgi:hypothetical protein
MPELHPTQCPCHDCWSRRLIRGAAPADERDSNEQLEDFGHLLKRQEVSQEDA